MSISIDETIGVHARGLSLRMYRSEILSANLANESTPGYQAQDVDFASAMRRLEHGPLTNHELMYRVPMQPSGDGNTVELAVEQAAFSRNSMDFQTSLTFLSAKFRGLKEAIEGR